MGCGNSKSTAIAAEIATDELVDLENVHKEVGDQMAKSTMKASADLNFSVASPLPRNAVELVFFSDEHLLECLTLLTNVAAAHRRATMAEFPDVDPEEEIFSLFSHVQYTIRLQRPSPRQQAEVRNSVFR